MLTRKIGKIVFGNATPMQLMLGCLLAGMLAFMPGFAQAPGLIALLTVLIVVLNVPLPLVGVVGILAHLLAMALLPLSFAVGRALLDGPTQPIFQGLINAPVFALFGFDYYATTGGLLVGLVVGGIFGLLVIKGVTAIRHRMAGLEENSEAYKKWMSKVWVKLLLKLLAGGTPKQGFKALLEQRRTKPLRPLGLAIASGLVLVAFMLQMLLAEPLLTHSVRTALERANGATVDLDRVDLELRNGRVTLHQLAMADPNALETDLIRAAQLEADISAADLLRKRVTLDRVVLTEARQGEPRTAPGYRTRDRRPPRPVDTQPGEKTLDDYLDQAEQWKQRLEQLQEWLERASGEDPHDPDVVDPEKEPSLPERLERRVAELGYANVRATHLVTGRPTLTILDLQANEVRTAALEDELVDIRAEHLSTHPHLHDHPPRVHATSSRESLRFDLHLASLVSADVESTIAFDLRNLSVDRAVGQLAQGLRPLSGGTIDLALDGALATAGGILLDLPLQVTVRDSLARVPGGQTAPVEQLMVPLGLRGPVANPRITLDDDRLADALVEAGASALAGRVRDEADRAVGGAVGGAVERASGTLQGRLDASRFVGDSGDASEEAEAGEDGDDAAADSARQRAEEAAGDAFRGLLRRGSDE